MAAKKKQSADAAERQGWSNLKKLGEFYSGKGSGSADAASGRSQQRVAQTNAAIMQSMQKPAAAPKPAASQKTGTVSSSKPSNKGSSTGGKLAAAATVAATGAAAVAGGRAAGRGAYQPATVYNRSGQGVMRLNEASAQSSSVRSSGRDAWGQYMGSSTGAGRTGVRKSPWNLFR